MTELPRPPRLNTFTRSIIALVLVVAGVAWAFMHPEHRWEGWMVALVGGGVVSPEILEGALKLRR